MVRGATYTRAGVLIPRNQDPKYRWSNPTSRKGGMSNENVRGFLEPCKLVQPTGGCNLVQPTHQAATERARTKNRSLRQTHRRDHNCHRAVGCGATDPHSPCTSRRLALTPQLPLARAQITWRSTLASSSPSCALSSTRPLLPYAATAAATMHLRPACTSLLWPSLTASDAACTHQ